MVNSQGNEEKKGLPPVVVILVAVIAIAAAGFMAYKSFGPPAPPPMSEAEKGRANTIEDMVTKTHGDMSKLSPDEVEKLNKMTNNQAGLAWMGTVQNMKAAGKLK